MKFKILKGTELFTQLIELRKRMNQYNEEAKKLAIELGGLNVASSSSGEKIAGGIDAIEFKEKPEGWRAKGYSWQNLYYPKSDKKNKAIHEKIAALPTVSVNEFNDIVGFKQQGISGDFGIGWARCPGFKIASKYALMEVSPHATYTPHKDAIEIMESEYNELVKKAK